MVDLNHVSDYWIWGYGPTHILWKRSLPPDRHYGQCTLDARDLYGIFLLRLLIVVV